MKKLRLFDSLKLVLATVACMFILNVAHADTNAIQSVIAYGKTEQNGTPTPTNPVPIMTNNGVLKLGKNLFNPATITNGGFIDSNGGFIENATYCHSDYIRVSSGKTYTRSNIGADSVAFYDLSKNFIRRANVTSFTATSDGYVRLNCRTNDRNRQFEEGATATAYEPYGVVANGLTETIRDAAGLKATAQMLLGLNDEYRDEQNINTGAITRKVGVKVFDGTENWQYSENGSFYYLVDSHFAQGPILITHFSAATSSTNATGNNKFLSVSSIIRFYPNSNSYSNVNSWKQFLAEQYANGTPVIIVYPLAESAQTTESVATQTLTTAPVRQTAGSILGMPIEVVLGDGTREWVRDMITIATTRYNEEQFEPVQNRLSDAMDAVDDVVTRTMAQAQAIDQIANEKQTRPNESCPVGKNCLLVEDENGNPNWYVIAGADEANPSTNP